MKVANLFTFAVLTALLPGCEARFGAPTPDGSTATAAADVGVAPAPQAPAVRRYLGRADGKLHVWFFDVGQGDAVLVRGPEGKTVLIDGGPEEAASYLSHRLPDLISGPLDVVTVTHAHPDHYGSLSQVLRVVGVQRFLAPAGGKAEVPEGYRQLVELLSSHSVPVFHTASPTTGQGGPLRIDLGKGATLEVLSSTAAAAGGDSGDDLARSASTTVRLTWARTSLLLVGDGHPETERGLLESGAPLESTLLKVAAHGANDATSAAFLRAVRPEAAIISVGAGNDRGAPSRQTLLRLADAGVSVFRTDLDGEVHAVSNGETFHVVTERAAAGDPAGMVHAFSATRSQPGHGATRGSDRTATTETRTDPAAAARGPYVASRHSDVFHVPECRAAQRIKEKNLLVFESREAAAKDRRPAGDCHP